MSEQDKPTVDDTTPHELVDMYLIFSGRDHHDTASAATADFLHYCGRLGTQTFCTYMGKDVLHARLVNEKAEAFAKSVKLPGDIDKGNEETIRLAVKYNILDYVFNPEKDPHERAN